MRTEPQEYEVKEAATTRIAGVVTEENGVTPIPGSVLSTFRMTIWDEDADETLIVDDRDILNANDATVDEDGNFIILLSPADVPIQNPDLPFERHPVLLNWTWGEAPERTGRHLLILVVRNLAKVA